MIFSKVRADKWPPFGKELLIRWTVNSLCFMSICSFGFEGETLILITPITGHCLPFRFSCGVHQKPFAIQYERINPTSIVKEFSPIIYHRCQLISITMPDGKGVSKFVLLIAEYRIQILFIVGKSNELA